MVATGRWRCAAVLALGLSGAQASDVTLLSRDGTLRIDGQLVQFDGEFYRVDTTWGRLVVDATGVVCDGPGCPDLTAFVAEAAVSGPEDTITRLVPALIDGFARDRGLRAVRSTSPDGVQSVALFEPGSDGASARLTGRFRLDATSSARAIADLVAGTADIAIALRDVTPDEIAAGEAAGVGSLEGRGQALILALDALVPAVSPRGPVIDGIDDGALVAVLAGTAADWGPLGGPAGWPVTLVLPPGTGALDHVLSDRLGAAGLGVPTTAARQTDLMADSVAMVRRDAFAMGLVPLSALDGLRPLALRGACGMDLAADADSLKSEDWPLTLPVYAYLPQGRPPALVREFLAFAQSDAAAPAIRAAGFIDQAVERRPFAESGRRLANAIRGAGDEVGLAALQRLVAELGGSERLTVAFRFAGGSADLDAPSRANVTLLARLLARGDFDGEALLFAGFSDGDGPAEANQRLSRSRAQAVLEAVSAAAEAEQGAELTVDLRATGFGEAAPLACDDSPWGRQVNRRVEVWVRPATRAAGASE
jgi:phosphate transport system substrate-binding protein